MKNVKRVLSLLLCLMMVITAVPMGAVVDSVKAFATETDDALTASLAEAKEYIDGITINSSSNDPATVVKNFKTHFTWDNEKRENSASYLYDWSYYNGVVFEGLEYLYENSGDEAYKDYVMEYMSSLIASDGTWAKCINSGYTSKECAGYDSTHGADCYKTASLLLDAYEMTKDSRYLTMAATLYADLDSAAKSYSLSNAGNNYRHTWASDSDPDLWLDGLYMILPFRAEYAKYIGDTEELNLIVDRMQWVSDNMYNSSKGLFYHAADSSQSNSGTYWLRSMGWYAAAIVDVMDSMEGDNLEAMKKQLVKLVDGMKAVQNSSNGMWLNNMNASQSSKNPYETSGTALVCYAVMKAVNNGWLDESYADMAILAFNGICDEKLSNNNLTDICFKGAPGSSNSTFYDNEGKGVGPFIMFYAEVLEYVNAQEEETPSDYEFTFDDTKITVSGATNVTAGAEVKTDEKALVEAKNYESYLLFDISADELADGKSATLTFTVPDVWQANFGRIIGISVEDGAVKEIEGTYESGKLTFTVDHFSAKGIALTAEVGSTIPVESTDDWKVITAPTNGTTTYTYTEATSITADGKYVIVGYSHNVALMNSNGYMIAQGVTINDSTMTSTTALTQWTFSANSNNTNAVNMSIYDESGERYLSYNSGYSLSEYNSTLYVLDQGDYFRIRNTSNHSSNNSRYFYYNGSSWTRSSKGSAQNVRLFQFLDSETVGGTDGLYGAIVGEDVYTVPFGTSEADALAKVMAGIDVVYTSDNTSTTGTVYGDEAEKMTWDIENYDPETPGTYNVSIKYDDVVIGTVTVTVEEEPEIEVTKVVINPASATVERDSTGKIKDVTLTYTYIEDNTEKTETIDLTIDMLDDDIFNVNKNGTYTGKVTYMGIPSENDFTLNVVNKTGVNDFPEYPNEGSVDVNKVIGDSSQFQNTGVAEVQLSTSGIPIKAPVDVILVTDLSNSMAWSVGGRTDATSHETTKMYNLAQSVNAFADTFLISEDGTVNDNTISLVTFGGYDAEYTNKEYTAYADPTQTLLLASNDVATIKNTINNIRILADDALNLGTSSTGYYLSFDGGVKYGENYGNTNYDHAFMQAYDAVTKLKAKYEEEKGIPYTESGREIFVLFMTDGAPSNYDGVYYNYKTDTNRADVNSTWVNANGETVTYTMGNNRAQYGQDAWYQYIAGGTYDTTTKTIPGNPLYWADKVYGEPGVEDIFSIGFDLDNGGFSSMVFTEDEGTPLAKVLEKLVTNKTLSVYNADNEESLKQIYKDLAAELREAATNAYFVDQMGDSFDIAKKSYVTKFDETNNEYSVALNPAPQITVSTYNIYLASDVGEHKFTPTAEMVGYSYYGITVTEAMVGSEQTGTVTSAMVGKRYGAPTVIETVVFNSEGTEAYSSVDGYTDSTTKVNGVTVTNHTGTKNILGEDKVIYAKNFWYNTSASTVKIDTDGDDVADYDLPAETFYWNIGTINEKEFVLSYYVYLEGAAEGEAQKGTYATNNYATLYYENLHGNEVNQDVQSPSLAWESASVSYGFYLVDKYGNPVVNRATGATGSFDKAVKVTQKVFYKEVLLNDSAQVATITVDTTVVPDGYEIYDNRAEYTISVDSGSSASGWVIKNTKFVDIDKDGVADANESVGTTYVTDYYSTLSTNIDSDEITDKAGYDYTNTTVWFAVVWKPQCIEDVVVIDYGLPVDIGVLENDMFGTAGTLVGLGLTSYEDIKANNQFNVTSIDKGANGLNYGSAKIEGSEVRYTPESMEMPSYDKFAYEVKYETKDTDGGAIYEYYSGNVTVIPATTVYYEDEFVTLKTYNKKDGVYTAEDGWDVDSAKSTSTQGEDRPGYYSLSTIDQNKIYGYDAAYDNMSTHSMNNSAMVTVNANKYATAEFAFYGTGFDVISVTSKDTGVITVQVKDSTGNLVVSKMVDTYYGMIKNGDNWQTTDRDALYQIPVIKVSDLAYGQYSVTIRASYYDALNNNRVDGEDGKTVGDGAYDIYLDAIRIYNPAGDGVNGTDTTIQDAYKDDNEAWPRYQEVRNNVIEAATLNANGATSINGIAFIDGIGDTANVSDYISYGPNNELYLKPGQAIVFNLTLPENSDKVHLAIKSADGNNVTYKIFDGASIKEEKDLDTIKANTLTTATDLYYDITSLKEKTIVVYNSGTSGIISLTNIKMTFTADPGEIGSVFYVSGDIINKITENMNKQPTFVPATEIKVSTSPKTVYAGNKITVTVTTGTDVEAVSVDDTVVTRYYKRGNTRVWTVSIDAKAAGTQNINVVAYNSDGIASAPVTATVTVNAYASWATTTIGKIVNTVLDWLFK